jgi:hypothetical protein
VRTLAEKEKKRRKLNGGVTKSFDDGFVDFAMNGSVVDDRDPRLYRDRDSKTTEVTDTN